MRLPRAPPVADDPEHGGGRGLGGTPSLGRPRERRPLFGGVYVLVPIWLGAPRPAWPPKSLMKRGPAGLLGFGKVPTRVTVDLMFSSHSVSTVHNCVALLVYVQK
jgi:hypothetical protein